MRGWFSPGRPRFAKAATTDALYRHKPAMNIQSMLSKLTRRLERDVAVAGAMVGSVAAMQKLFPRMEGYCRLTVSFYQGGSHWWEYSPCARPVAPWRDFQKWYHGRPQSVAYVMASRDGSTMFQRKDIATYSIIYGERETSQSGGDQQPPG